MRQHMPAFLLLYHPSFNLESFFSQFSVKIFPRASLYDDEQVISEFSLFKFIRELLSPHLFPTFPLIFHSTQTHTYANVSIQNDIRTCTLYPFPSCARRRHSLHSLVAGSFRLPHHFDLADDLMA